mgnify:CR=1 FL=1
MNFLKKYQQGGAAPQGGISEIEGQYTSEIQVDQEGNQYVVYEGPDGQAMKIYGDWESYGNVMAPGGGGVGPGEARYIEDRSYPVFFNNETGQYELDAQSMESEMMATDERQMAQQAVGGQGESSMTDLLEQLSQRGMRNQAAAGAPSYAMGGMVSDEETRGDSRRASRESDRMTIPETRLARKSNDVDELMSRLQGYSPKQEENRKLARQVGMLGAGAGAFQGAAPIISKIYQRAKSKAANNQPLTAAEKIALQIFGAS